MFSSHKLVMATAATLMLSACGWQPFKNLRWGNDPSPAPGSLQLNLGKYSCMSEVGKKVDAYFAAQMSQNDIHNFMGCIRGALSKFVMIERGTTAGSYTPADLAAFLNRYYLQNEILTPAFADEIMKIKVLILGGTTDTITDDEINGLSDLVTFVENQAIANLPYIPYYTGINVHNVTSANMQSMTAQLQDTGVQMAKKLSAQGVSYDMASLNSFLTELRKFLKWNEIRPNSQSPAQTVKIVQAYKAIVTGKNDTTIRPEEWAPVADSISTIFSMYTVYKVQLKNAYLMAGEGLDALVTTVSQATSLLSRIIDRNDAKMISFAATDELIDALADTHMFPSSIRPTSIKTTYQFLIQKAFHNPLASANPDLVKGMGEQELSEMRTEFSLWADGQRYLSANAGRALQIDAGSNALFDFRQFISQGVDQSDINSSEIEQIVKMVPPFFRAGDQRAYIVPESEMKNFGVFDSVADLSIMNTMRGLVRILVRGAGTDDHIALMSTDWLRSGITEDEMAAFFDNVHDLAVDLKYLDPSKPNGGKRAFDEAKLFTYDGNGINAPDGQGAELLNIVQGMEYLAEIWSGGQVRNLVYQHATLLCQQQGVGSGPLDVFGTLKLNRPCLENNFFSDNMSDFANLPHLRDAFLRQTPAQRLAIVHALETIANNQCVTAPNIEESEIADMVTILHYVEVIFSVYDTNGDGKLSGQEIMHAFKRFSGYIQRQVQQVQGKAISISLLKSVYAYLVQNRSLPSSTKGDLVVWLTKQRYFNDDINQYEGNSTAQVPDMSLDRAGLIDVLRVLAQVDKTPSAPGSCN